MADLITAEEATLADAAFGELPTARQAALLASVSRKVERHCRREFTQGTHTEYHDGEGLPRLYLRHRPVASVTSVAVNGTAVDNAGGDAWTLDGEAGILTRGDGKADARFAAGWPRGTRNIAVVLVGGYASIPEDVKEACYAELRYLTDTSKVSGVFQQEKLGDYFYSMNQYTSSDSGGGVGSPGARSLLAPYVQDDLI